MKQVSLVALYGHKEKVFKKYIQNILNIIQDSEIAEIFIPYQFDQMHSTIIGLEKSSASKKYYNINYNESLTHKQKMDLNCLNDLLTPNLPLNIRVGGFSEDNNSFLSNEEYPFTRSFQINWTNRKVIIIGWPYKTESDLLNKKLLWNIRKSFIDNKNIKHKYKDDNDFFMVIGEIDGNIDILKFNKEGEKLEKKVRDHMSQNPIDLTIHNNDIYIVQYEKETLEIETSESWRISDIKNTELFLKSLY